MKPVCRSDLVVQQVNDELVVLDQANEKIHRLNETAAFLWHQCDGTCTEKEIAERVMQKFDVTADVAHKDVTRFIGEFATLGLLALQPKSERG